jgi:hypothetical protein
MGNQYGIEGKPAVALFTAGVQSSKRKIPLGKEFGDSNRRYRWAHIAESSWPNGCVLVKSETDNILSAGITNIVSVANGFGDTVGDNIIKVTGMTGLTNPEIYEGGFFDVYAGTGKGHSYKIKTCEVGNSGTTKIYLADQIRSPLESGVTLAFIRSNPYYGLKLASTPFHKIPENYAGATVLSSQNSGYCLVQVDGQGFGYLASSISAGRYLAVETASGRLGLTNLSNGSPVAVAISVTPALLDSYCVVDWMFE